ncbi:MAG: diaminopimelate epimerase, partial [Clostridia bacterium]|nr:diaminopimelate epimerase [Clostridia bacterium]
NSDGSEGRMAGNNIRCVGKYLYDKGDVRSEDMTIETASGIHTLKLYLRDGKVSSVSVDMGRAELSAAALPAAVDVERMIDYPLTLGGEEYRVTGVSVGNPHCVVFRGDIDGLKLEEIGPRFEYAAEFPERTNAEFVRVVNKTTLRMRVWERGNGETLACGTGACAAVIAAVENGYCQKGDDVTVKLLGGDLTVNYTDERVILSGEAELVFEGEFTY